MRTGKKMGRRAGPVLSIGAVFWVAAPCLALMEFFGADPMPNTATWPAGLLELVNYEGRFAGSVGPIADTQTYYAGDTIRLNAFLRKFAALPDAMLKVAIGNGDFGIAMKNFTGTDRTVVADWSLHIAEFYEGRPDKEKFEGRKVLVKLRINAANAIDLEKLAVPVNLVVEAGDEHKEFVDRHNERRAQAAAHEDGQAESRSETRKDKANGAKGKGHGPDR